jgi:glutaredoxin
MKPNKEILVYGTRWCGDTKRACRFLDENSIEYRFIDIDQDKNAESVVREINEGSRSVPTIIFKDGSFLVEPDEQTLAEKVGII